MGLYGFVTKRRSTATSKRLHKPYQFLRWLKKRLIRRFTWWLGQLPWNAPKTAFKSLLRTAGSIGAGPYRTKVLTLF